MLSAVPPADVTAGVSVQKSLKLLAQFQAKKLEDQRHVAPGVEAQILIPGGII